MSRGEGGVVRGMADRRGVGGSAERSFGVQGKRGQWDRHAIYYRGLCSSEVAHTPDNARMALMSFFLEHRKPSLLQKIAQGTLKGRN